jgi:hypothetical protein
MMTNDQLIQIICNADLPLQARFDAQYKLNPSTKTLNV